MGIDWHHKEHIYTTIFFSGWAFGFVGVTLHEFPKPLYTNDQAQNARMVAVLCCSDRLILYERDSFHYLSGQSHQGKSQRQKHFVEV